MKKQREMMVCGKCSLDDDVDVLAIIRDKEELEIQFLCHFCEKRRIAFIGDKERQLAVINQNPHKVFTKLTN